MHDQFPVSAITLSNCSTVRPVTGSTRSGAISASGSRTNRRPRKRGCGTTKDGSFVTSLPNSTRSISSVPRRTQSGPLAPPLALDCEEGRQKIARRQRTTSNGCGVEEIRLPAGDAHWRRFTVRGNAKVRQEGPETNDREVEVRPAVAKVRSKRESRRHRHPGGYTFCFSLHVMQTRVHGMAFSRASAMGSAQSRQAP